MLFDKDPDFINDEGIKWWFNEISTNYAKNENHNGISLNINCWLIELQNGYKTYILLDSETNDYIYESQKLEEIGTKIDILKLIKYYEGGE